MVELDLVGDLEVAACGGHGPEDKSGGGRACGEGGDAVRVEPQRS